MGEGEKARERAAAAEQPWQPGSPDSLLARYGLAPEGIARESLRRLRERLGRRAPSDPVALRMVYAAGDPDLAASVEVHPGFLAAAVGAVRARRPIVCDGHMVAAGITARWTSPLGVEVVTAIDAPDVVAASRGSSLTRAAWAMVLERGRLDGALAVVGTSPTALLAVLDLVDAGLCRPAALVATPVGLVAAAESKEELCRRGIPFATVRGERGGAGIAAAAVNAVLAHAAGRADR